MSSLHPLKLHNTPYPPPFARLHDIQIAVRVAPYAVARTVDRITPSGESLAVECQDADHTAIMFGDVNDVIRIDIEECWTDQLGGPDCQQIAALIEYLHPIVLPIGNKQPAATINPHTMRQVELAGRLAWFAPGKQIFGSSRELVDAGITVAVAHEHRSIRGESDVRRQVERPAAMRHLPPR